jgi:hypothetical protein
VTRNAELDREAAKSTARALGAGFGQSGLLAA